MRSDRPPCGQHVSIRRVALRSEGNPSPLGWRNLEKNRRLRSTSGSAR
jgi:hypothetical protein